MGKLPTREAWDRALVQRHGPALQQKFRSATVAICGLGGLGSHIALALARAGVGHLILIDFDQVDLTNLHRQHYKASQIGMAKTAAIEEILLEVAPYLSLTTHCRRLTRNDLPQLLAGAQVVCEAFDDPEAKAMLVNGVLEATEGHYLVAASGMAGLGSANHIRTRRVGRRLYLCGDGVSDVDGPLGLVSSRVMVCAAHQAHAVLRILAGEFDT